MHLFVYFVSSETKQLNTREKAMEENRKVGVGISKKILRVGMYTHDTNNKDVDRGITESFQICHLKSKSVETIPFALGSNE